MKEYSEKDPKRIEDLLAVLIGAELVTANELKQYKESGLRVIEYGTEDVQRIIKGEKTYCTGLVPSDENGGKTWHCFTPEAQEIWDNDKKAKEFQYWETVNNKVDAVKRLFLSDLKKSPNPAETIADRIRQGKWKLNPYSDPNAVRELGLNPNAHLKEPWINLKRSRQFDNRFHNHWQIKAEVENEFLQWLIEFQKNPKPEMIAGQEFAFSADGKQIEKHPLKTIVEYFNEKGAEVQLFTKGNEHALLIINAGIDETELDELARYEADPIELQALFNLKFSEAQDSGKVSTQQSFAKAEANRLRRAWKDDASRFPIAEQWLSYLQAIAEAKEQPKGDADTSTATKESKGGKGAENGVKLTLWQAAFLLAYKREMLYDSRNPDYKVSQNFAKELCHLDSHTSGGLLYDKWRVLRQSSERKRFFSSALDAEKEGIKWHDKRPQSFLKDIEKIVPLLKGDQKTDAENDLSDWNTMYSKAME